MRWRGACGRWGCLRTLTYHQAIHHDGLVEHVVFPLFLIHDEVFEVRDPIALAMEVQGEDPDRGLLLFWS